MVGASSLTVSADKMNVLFIGVDNPVSVGVSGVPSENVSASITQGSLSSKGNGKYVAKVTSPGTARVNVSAVIDGQKKNMGSMEFRVARIPDPVPEVAGKRGGTIPAAVFRAQIGVVANLKDFYFDARYIVTSFKMGFNGTGYPDYIERTSSSARFTPEMQQLMQRAKPGSRIYIDNIKARGPDGTTRDLGSINFTLQ